MKKQYLKLPALHLACGDDFMKPMLACVLVTKDEIFVSNLHIGIVHETKDIFSDEFIKAMPERFLIHKSVWRNIYKGSISIDFENDLIKVKRDNYTAYFPIETEERIGKYPDYKAIFPNKQSKIESICFSPNLLNMLYKAMFVNGQEPIRFVFEDDIHAIRVNPVSREFSCYGLIMPVLDVLKR